MTDMSQKNHLQTQIDRIKQRRNTLPSQEATQFNLELKPLNMNDIKTQKKVLSKNRVYTRRLGGNPSIMKIHNVLL